MSDPMRVLVTGSRTWDIPAAVERELDVVTMEARTTGRALIVVHGGNSRGADRIARDWARRKNTDGWPVFQNIHAADWDAPCRADCLPGHRRTRKWGGDYCPAVGQYRNADMVALGADVCLAFIRDNSPGASGCASMAEERGIRTLRFHYERMEGS